MISLTDEQQVILDSREPNIYISSAPGSGKSMMLSYIAENKLSKNPSNTLCLVTFTNKASRSIISKCSNIDTTRVTGGTFHGLAYRFMRYNNIHWNICDEGKKRLIIKKVFNCKKDKKRFKELLETISLGKSKWPMGINNEVTLYNNELIKYNLVDFDDMIYHFVSACADNSFSLPLFNYVLVDELQDTAAPQLEMLKVIQSKIKSNMIAVADNDQNIYAWRGARPENITDFINIFKCKVYTMGYNFRSGKKIVYASARMIENNKNRISKVIRPFKTIEGSIITSKHQDPFKEIDYVIRRCKYSTSKIAILYRNRTYKHQLEFALRKAHLEYTVNDSLDIVDRSAIKVMFSTMKLAASVGDIYDLEIASKGLKGLGAVTAKQISDKVTKTYTLNDLLEERFNDEKKVKRVQSLKDLNTWYKEHRDSSLDLFTRKIETYLIDSFDYQEDMKRFIIDITKEYKTSFSDILDLCNDLGLDAREEETNDGASITLSTVHSYKGLQEETVIIPWTQQFLDKSNNKIIDIEEERRLFYVGITRPISILYLTYTGEIPQFIKEMKL